MRAGRHSWQRALFDACNTFFQQANAPIECGDEFETDEEIQKVHFGRELLGVIKGETPDLDAKLIRKFSSVHPTRGIFT